MYMGSLLHSPFFSFADEEHDGDISLCMVDKVLPSIALRNCGGLTLPMKERVRDGVVIVHCSW